MELQIGDKAPAFELGTDDNGAVSSKGMKGKPFVLYFYPKDDTPGCTSEAQDFATHYKRFKTLGLEIIGISKDTPARHDKFKTKYDLNFPLASDPEAITAQAYGVWGEKRLYGRTYMGMERATFLIDAKGIIRQIWRKVKVAGHAEAVLAAANQL